MQIIDGKKIAAEIRAELKQEVEVLKTKGAEPALAVIMVGDDPASLIYVRNKEKACAEVGIKSQVFHLAQEASQAEVLATIEQVNRDDNIHGLLVQLPLPEHLNEQEIIQAVVAHKDVDCFCYENVGKMFLGQGEVLPCTPAGIIELLRRSDVEIAGQDVTIVGRSRIVGKPLGAMLTNLNATVTLCHSQTKDLAQKCAQADILISAVGKAGFVTAEMMAARQTVIDVGVNRTEEGKLVGDVDWQAAQRKVEQATPVPGGVGPMTIAMLLKNTVLVANVATKKRLS